MPCLELCLCVCPRARACVSASQEGERGSRISCRYDLKFVQTLHSNDAGSLFVGFISLSADTETERFRGELWPQKPASLTN